jgi:hypothetical protein
VLPFGRLWYGGRDAAANAIGYAMHCSRSHDAVIRVYDAAGNVIETREHNSKTFTVPIRERDATPVSDGDGSVANLLR